MQGTEKIQTQLNQIKLKKAEELINLIKINLLKVDDEHTAQEIAKLFDEYQDKIKVKLNFATIPHINTDMVSLTAILLSVRAMGRAVSSIPILKITHKDGKKYLYRSPDSNVTTKLVSLFVSLDLCLDLCFFEPLAKLEKQPWQSQSIDKIYRPEITFFYSLVHKVMGDYLLNYLHKHNLSKSNHLNKEILLISAACGDGGDLQVIRQNLQEYQVSLAGFDINDFNIQAAKDKLGNGNFFVGDISDIAKHFSEIKKWYKQINNNEPQFTVVIYSGILQRHLLRGTVEATHYLQLALRLSQLVMMSSIQFSLTTRSIAKAIGYNVVSQNINYTSTKGHPESRILYCLEKQSSEQRLSYIIKRSDKRSPDRKPTNIDLSLSANPLGDLILIIKNYPLRLAETKQLDLSWSHFAENELDIFLKTIPDKLPNLEKILIANIESWAKSLLDKKLPYTIYQRKDVLNEHEVPVFSVPSARFFKLYKSPSVVIIQEKSKITMENNCAIEKNGLQIK